MKKILLFFLTVIPMWGFAQNQLLIPPTASGAEINLGLHNSQVEFFTGFNTHTIGYNGDILGPTLILKKGEAVTLNVTNNLTETTTVHWHGLHVAAKNDGGPHTVIKAGEIWSPSFTVLDNAGTYWYHPHLHEHTEEQVTRGAAGFIIVQDDEEANLNLPRTYGEDDFPVVIQSRAFDANKQFLTETALDETMMCNGTLDALLHVPAQIVRLRLLNGSTERVYNLGFSDNRNFHQIATDGGLLNAPVALTRLRLAPGERAEILVDLSTMEGQSLNLMSFASELPNGTYGASSPTIMPMGGIVGYTNNPLNGHDFNVLQLSVGAHTNHPVTSIPALLKTNITYSEANADAVRNLTFQPAQMSPTTMVAGPFVINGVGFDADKINYKIPLNNTEIWELTNRTGIAHPFHIHDVQFYILDINGSPPPANMRGKKDVVLVPPGQGTVRFITKFEDFADEHTPYMYHCHMLSHEDAGMMGQFIVVDNTTDTYEQEENSVLIYPNPVANIISLQGLPPSTIELYNTAGQLLESKETIDGDEKFNLAEYASGVYYFNIISLEKNHTYKVIKH